MKTSKRLIILEGPDGAGKTRLAKALAAALDARYVHHGPYPGVGDIAPFYAESMDPAVLGHADVVMDRCWISERPYGAVFRAGADRLGARTRILERLAWRCRTLVVRCLPTWPEVHANFGEKPEMLERVGQLEAVYSHYEFSTDDRLDVESGGHGGVWGSLPSIHINPLVGTDLDNIARVVQGMINASIPHALEAKTLGNLRGARVLIVGEPSDLESVELGDISERDLYWADVNHLTPAVADLALPVLAVGDESWRRLYEARRQYNPDDRFASTDTMADVLKGMLCTR